MNWPDPPGYVETVARCREPRYGWIVLSAARDTPRTVLSVPASDWKRAKATFPYQWLNRHPEQPTSVARTRELAEKRQAIKKP